MTYEGTQSTTPCPPSYSPASQRSRYSQPNLPTLLVPYERRSPATGSVGGGGGSAVDRRIRMSQPILNSSFSGINFAGINRGSRLSYTSLRAASGDNSINEEERLSTPNVNILGGSAEIDHGSSRLSQPDVRRYALRGSDVPTRRDRLSQPTLVTGDYYPGRAHQRLSQPCLSIRKESLPTMVLHSPSPPPQTTQQNLPHTPLHSPSPPAAKHKRFAPCVNASQRDRLSQLDIGAKYRNLKDVSGIKFNRDRFSIPELETQNDLRLMAGTPKQRFSLDSQLTRNQDSGRSRLLPIASSPISENQRIDDSGIPGGRLKTPTCEGLESVIVASTSPIFPPGERNFLKTDISRSPPSPSVPLTTASKGSNTNSAVTTAAATLTMPVEPSIAHRERMSVPEIRNSSLRRLLDPPARQRHSIAGNLRQSLLMLPSSINRIAPQDNTSFDKKSQQPIEKAVDALKRHESKENVNHVADETVTSTKPTSEPIVFQEPKHIQRHYSYTYDTGFESSSVLGKISVGLLPRKKYLESNFDENEQVITTVIETEVPFILTSPKYTKKTTYSNETPKWIKKYMENESPKVRRKPGQKKDNTRANARTSRRKSSLESIEAEKTEKVRSRSVSSVERSPVLKNIDLDEETKNFKNTYVRIVSAENAQKNKYEIGIESNWPVTGTDCRGSYADECDDTDSDESTSV